MMKIDLGPDHPEFLEGYMDGQDLSCPEPNENRSARYRHSFYIGRSEAEGKPAGSYKDLIRCAYESDEAERKLNDQH